MVQIKEELTLRACLEYQACDDRECDLPEQIDFEIPLAYLDNVRG